MLSILNQRDNVSESPQSEAVEAATVYRCMPGYRWVVETRGLTLFHEAHGAFCCVPYPFAAIWDLLHRGYGFDDAARLTEYIAGVPTQTARNLILRAVQGWQEQGVLRKGGHDGECLTHLDL